MRKQWRDYMGGLYSTTRKGGCALRFGGFPTYTFLKQTESLEKLRPGVREEIVAEAHIWHCGFISFRR